MQDILATGITGLVGSRIAEVLPNINFIPISRGKGVDITNFSSLENAISNFQGKYILHLAAKADVDGCEDDREFNKEGEAWRVNVLGTENIAKLSNKYNKKIIYISTDFVFDGTKSEELSYKEDDVPNPINWYGFTKYQGEQKILENCKDFVILRVAYPYGESKAEKKDFVHIIASLLKEKRKIKAVTDQFFCPTHIDDIAFGIEKIISLNSTGLFHLVGSEKITPYEIGQQILKKLNLPNELISKTTRSEYFANRAPRPFNLWLNNDKIKSLGIVPKAFREGISELFF